MTATKYVIEVYSPNGPFSISQWEMCQAIRSALKTLSHKKHKLGPITVLAVEPMTGSLAHAVDMVAAIKAETEEAVRLKVDTHEDDYKHDSGRWAHYD